MAYKKYYFILSVLLLSTKAPLYVCEASNSLLISRDDIYQKLVMKDKNFSGIDFRNDPLPQDLSGCNLTNVNFTGKSFSYTNLTNTKLKGAILTNTTCDYEKCFFDNVKFNLIINVEWYKENLPKVLTSIAGVYLLLSRDSQKAKLLQIASGLAYLPYYQGREFYIKVEHWACQLILLKQQIKSNLKDKLICFFVDDIMYDANNCCWKTSYPACFEQKKGMYIASQWCRKIAYQPLPNVLGVLIQKYITESAEKKHVNFDQHLKVFKTRLGEYDVSSKNEWGYTFYKRVIEENIQGLAQAYPQLTSESLRKEVIDILYTLIKSYKMQHFAFLTRYLSCQNRLVNLKTSTRIDAICYNYVWQIMKSSWTKKTITWRW